MTDTHRFAHRFASPFGDIYAVVDTADALRHLDFEGGRNAPADEEELTERFDARGLTLRFDAERLAPVREQLAAYFAGERTEFDLPVSPEGTEFQRRVWGELQRIRFGETLSYGELASRLGSPGASRAVGSANGANPVSIVIPCHRVIGADGSLTGYGGGMERKRGLLTLEGSLEVRPSLFVK